MSDTETDVGFYVVSNSYTCDVFLETRAKISVSNRKVFRLYFNYLFFCHIFPFRAIYSRAKIMFHNEKQHDTMEGGDVLQLNTLPHFTDNETED